MGEIFKFIIGHFNQLKPIDFFFLFVLLVLSSFAVFIVLRWIYSALIKSQKQLIQIKDNLIRSYQSNIEQIGTEIDYLKNRYSTLTDNFNSLAVEYNQSVEAQTVLQKAYQCLFENALAMRVALNCLKIAYLNFAMYDNAREMLFHYSMLELHKKLPEAPEPDVLVRRLDEIKDAIHQPFQSMGALIAANPETLFETLVIPKEINRSGQDEIVNSTIDDVVDKMSTYSKLYSAQKADSKQAI